MKHVTGMETCTQTYFLFKFNLVQIKVSYNLAILTLQFDDVTVKTIYRSWWSFYDHELHKHELFPYSFSMNWPYPARKNEVKSHFTHWPRLLQLSRYWTAKSNLYFEISQLLSLSSLASLVKRPKQLSFFPHASVRKTSFRSMNLYLDYLLSW